MMYKTFTFLLFSLLLNVVLTAQEDACTPGMITQDTSIILPIPYNSDNMTGGLDSTCVGLFYEQVMTTLVPDAVPFAGTEISVDSFTLDLEGAIIGLPEGLTYACNPPNCVFLPDSVSCFVITGPIDQTVDPDTYELELKIRAYNTFFPGGLELTYPNDFPNTNGSYFIHVETEVDCNVVVNSTSDLQREIKASISPNPASDFVQLNIEAASSKDVQVMVTDVLGKVYQEQSIRLEAGFNTIPYYLDGMSRGIYFLNITDGKEFLSHKLVIEN